jgi:hypothetical protein
MVPKIKYPWILISLGAAYSWFWLHTEFWIANKFKRRPFTFILRDWIFPHLSAFTYICLVWFLGLYSLAWFHGLLALTMGIISAALIAHLVWGSRWIKGERK